MKSYKILKLKSGEDLIGSVRLSKDGSIKIHRPMVFKSIVTQDMFGGMREVFMLKDWLILSEEKIAAIAKDSINTIVSASKEISSLYEQEKMKDDTRLLKPKQPKSTSPIQQAKDDIQRAKNDINDMKDLLRLVEEMTTDPNKIPEEESNLKDFANPQKGDKMVFMNLVFSPEVIVELLKSGLLDRKELGAMINEITNENGEGMHPNKYTGDKKDKKDLGNKWTDWNADPNSEDYK